MPVLLREFVELINRIKYPCYILWPLPACKHICEEVVYGRKLLQGVAKCCLAVRVGYNKPVCTCNSTIYLRMWES